MLLATLTALRHIEGCADNRHHKAKNRVVSWWIDFGSNESPFYGKKHAAHISDFKTCFLIFR